jgi:hypothetical protein
MNREKYFFAFANTVAAKSYKYHGDCHGWVGLKFQHSPSEPPSQVILHVRMLDATNLRQQEALGVLGVNLIYACYHYHQDLPTFLSSLLEGDLKNSIEVNLIRLEGPIFAKIDATQANLLLLQRGLTPAILLSQDKGPAHLGEELYNKQVIIHRGQFDPPIKTDQDILRSARDHYCGEKTEGLCDPYLIHEIQFDPAQMNLEQLTIRVRDLEKCQSHIMVTSFDRTYKLTEYIARFTNNHIMVVFRASKILEILENEKLASLDRLSRIFNERTRLYIYPVAAHRVHDDLKKDPSQGLFNLSNYQPSDLNKYLYLHLSTSGYLQELNNFDPHIAAYESGDLPGLQQSQPALAKALSLTV